MSNTINTGIDFEGTVDSNVSESYLKRGFQPAFSRDDTAGNVINSNNSYNSSFPRKNDIIDIEDVQSRESIPKTNSDRAGYGIIGSDAIVVSEDGKIKEIREKTVSESIDKEDEEKDIKEEKRNAPLPIWRWMLTLLALCIPGINFIFLLAWAFGRGNRGRQNLSRAILLFVVIVSLIIGGVFYFFGVTEIVDFAKSLLVKYDVKQWINEYILKNRF